jgi:hypothetical protein
VPLVQLRAAVTALEVSLIYLADFCSVSFRELIHFVSRIFCVTENYYVHTARNFSLSGHKLTNLGEFSLRQSLALFFLPGSARKLAHSHFEKEIII